MKKIVIAIDGPAASGKSTTAKLLAQKLGYVYIDTGAMYRAFALKALTQDVLERLQTDEAFLRQFVDSTDVRLSESSVWLDGKDVTTEIRTNDVSKSVSKVSALKAVREKLSAIQKKLGEAKGVVMDGRDIGTAIFPNAELKIYMLASVQERAKRRYAELKAKNAELGVTIEELEAEIRRRDEEDMNRAVSPLRKADDAIELDTSALTIEEQVERIYKLALEKINDCKGAVQ
ncbi:MAG: (d)CMP kinase [Chloroherpetonaceae bacterium]|nr:(d)CMP kinase [Chloroherpetonaceae bacterium]MDW8437049.1 (d)CMP kinase [Chloroherpetonaceae bacterium]